MLTDQFINLVCLTLLNDSVKVTDATIQDIGCVLSYYSEEEIPLAFRKKFDLTKTIYRLRAENKSKDLILDDIISANHFSELDSYLKQLSQRSLSPEKIDPAIDQLSQKKQLVSLMSGVPQIEEFVTNFNTQNFADTNQIIDGWGNLITNLHSQVSEFKRKKTTSTIKELDLLHDSFNDVTEQISLSYSGQNSISTGFSELDGYMNGGFEKTRLYIFGGASGDGKSVLLNNFIKNAVETNPETDDEMRIFSYYTMENLIDESLVRLYCSLADKDIEEMLQQFNHERGVIERTVKEWQQDHHAFIYMRYFPPTLTSVSDLISCNDMLTNKYEGRAKVAATYVDYLDLLRSGQTFDLHRLELGQVTIDMKVAAVMGGIPWVTVTQLNRGAYNIKEDVSLANMGESIKKVEHSDFVGILRNMSEASEDRDIEVSFNSKGELKIIIGKNRSGPKNKIIKLQSEFSKFLISGDRSPNPQFEIHQDSTLMGI